MKDGPVQESTPLGGAFGIGALEDPDEDDYSVYDNSIRGSGQRIMDLDDDDHGPHGYEISRRSALGRTQQASKPARPPTSTETYHDGTPALPGFAISSKAVQPDLWFEPPSIPRDWQLNPKRIFDLADRPPEDAPAVQGPSGRPPPAVDARGKTVLTADDRGTLLGEEQIKAPPRSVFDFISAKNKERLSQFTSKLPSSSTNPAIPSVPATAESVVLTVPVLDKPTATAALKGFMPFSDDPAKQSRYKFYLQSQAGQFEGVFAPKCEPGRMGELNKELEDFAKSAKVFKPMSMAMAGRFVSGSNSALDMKAPQPGLRTVEKEEPEEETVVEEKMEETLTPAMVAVRTGQFGVLTRRKENFYPVKLLCKRFNVPDPHPDGPTEDAGEEKEEKELLNKSAMNDLRQEGGFTEEQPYDLKTTTETSSTAKAPGVVGLGEDESQGKTTLTYERPPMDLFKAIFAESESESEDEENKPVRQPAAVSTEATKPTSVAEEVKKPTPNPLEPVSFTDFKPTFVSKADRTTTSTAIPSEKKKKEKKKRKAALSFAVEDDEVDVSAPKEKKSKSDGRDKKRRKEEPVADQEDEWVEKEVTQPPLVAKVGRARASDFL